jgi:hypothetical protein
MSPQTLHLPVGQMPPPNQGWELITGNTFLNCWQRNAGGPVLDMRCDTVSADIPPATIIRTTDGGLFSVRPSTPPGFPNAHDHLWLGMPVKRSKGGFVPKANAVEALVRKAGCEVMS